MSESQWVYLMRGLPSCGKSHTARRLVGDSGLVCETDEYFLTEVGDDPEKFDYRDDLMERARKWNFDRFKFAIAQGLSPIVVDRGNSLSLSSQVYVRYASEHGYEVRLCEPESEWWQEIRVLLKNKDLTWPVLEKWAGVLAKWNQETHRVPLEDILRRMKNWKHGLTVKDILKYRI
ncbi:MAG TPA: hypothetical protein EYQ50_19665 [Verrucomicrobiales bacterium]|nr:hypothetical protein [Verrucomicrobiales bacterium]HIL70579.1 hypothetical protein [Verrucomicrobiota bacterium]